MAECSSISSDSTSILVTCSICTEPIRDPRALPCGHTYCGPPETCLDALRKSSETPDILTCALCNENHHLKISDLKPLYGFRELLESHSSEVSSYRKEIEDLKHKMSELQQKCTFEPPTCQNNAAHTHFEGIQVQFWCKDCKESICEDCLELFHSRHSVKSYKRFLQVEVERKLMLAEQYIGCSSSGDDLLAVVENKTNDLNQKRVQWMNLQTQIRTMQNVMGAFDLNKQKLKNFARGQDGCSYEVVRAFLDTNFGYPELLYSHSSTQTLRQSKKLLFNFGNPRLLTSMNSIKWLVIVRSDDEPYFSLGIRKVESAQNKCHHLAEIIIRSGKGHSEITVGIEIQTNTPHLFVRSVQAPAEQNVVAVSIRWPALFARNFVDQNGDLWIFVENVESL